MTQSTVNYLHVAEQLDLPVDSTTAQQAFNHATKIARRCGYYVRDLSRGHLIITVRSDAFLASYSDRLNKLHALGKLIPCPLTNAPTLWISGEMELPTRLITRDSAYDTAFNIASQIGHTALKVGDTYLLLENTTCQVHLVGFNNTERRISEHYRIQTLYTS